MTNPLRPTSPTYSSSQDPAQQPPPPLSEADERVRSAAQRTFARGAPPEAAYATLEGIRGKETEKRQEIEVTETLSRGTVEGDAHQGRSEKLGKQQTLEVLTGTIQAELALQAAAKESEHVLGALIQIEVNSGREYVTRSDIEVLLALKSLRTVSHMDPRGVRRNYLNIRETLVGLLERNPDLTEYAVSVPTFDDRGRRSGDQIVPFRRVCANWQRAMSQLKQRDFWVPEEAIARGVLDDLPAYGEVIYNARATPRGDLPNPRVLRLDIKDPQCQVAQACFTCPYLSEPIAIAFHAPIVGIETLSQFANPEGRAQLKSYFSRLSDGAENPLSAIRFNVELQCNCLSFGAGYMVPSHGPRVRGATQRAPGPLIPGAKQGQHGTEPVAWMADKYLQERGCYRVDDGLCADPDLALVQRSLEHPIYLIAVVHSGQHTGLPDAHVMRCFYERLPSAATPEQGRFVWLESGGRNVVASVTEQRQEGRSIITGIPANPHEAFCNPTYPCFLGYYLVADTAAFRDERGTPAPFVKNIREAK